MTYTLTLTDTERSAIDWIGARYWNGNDLYKLLIQCEVIPDHEFHWNGPAAITWNIPEHVAWQIAELAQEQSADGSNPFPCFAPELCAKLQAFLDQIV